MKGMLAVIIATALTILCWGVYGPTLHVGQELLGDAETHTYSRWRPFMCVGVAYFLIAVLVPTIILQLKGEVGEWTKPGMIWSFSAGAAGAIGALGIIMAFAFGGHPMFVMPLVFGFAPVVNTFCTMFMTKSFDKLNAKFFFGLLLVATGAVMVMVFKPSTKSVDVFAKTEDTLGWVIFFIAATALSWGCYGPVLHKGQMKMGASKLRPLICVGLAYFLVAVVVPAIKLSVSTEAGSWDSIPGIVWSLGAGAAGAIGALGIILAFNSGGKPIYVMPLVFGGAPVVNTFTSIISSSKPTGEIKPVFLAALVIVAIGAVTVLVFAPRPGKPAAKASEPNSDDDTTAPEPA